MILSAFVWLWWQTIMNNGVRLVNLKLVGWRTWKCLNSYLVLKYRVIKKFWRGSGSLWWNDIDKGGKPTRFKVRYVLCGYEQILGRDYTWTTSPTAWMESFCLLLHIAASLNWDLKQFNVKQAFLNGVLDLDKVQFMAQPEGFKAEGKEDYVWHV